MVLLLDNEIIIVPSFEAVLKWMGPTWLREREEAINFFFVSVVVGFKFAFFLKYKEKELHLSP